MEKSSFQFTNPKLKRLDFVVHDHFKKTVNPKMEIRLSAQTQYNENEDGTLSNKASVQITLCVGSKDDTTPFYIEAEETADFRWEEGAFDDAQVQQLLEQNGTALLISYLRPIIATITAASPYPSYNLPYLDLTKMEEQK